MPKQTKPPTKLSIASNDAFLSISYTSVNEQLHNQLQKRLAYEFLNCKTQAMPPDEVRVHFGRSRQMASQVCADSGESPHI